MVAALLMDPICDLAELSPARIKAVWHGILRDQGWDGEDARCRLDSPTPYR